MSSAVARTYAKAFYESAASSGQDASRDDFLAQERKQLSDLLALIDGSKELQVVLMGPVSSGSEKIAILEALSKKMEIAPTLMKFLELLAKKGRFSLLAEVRETLESVRLEAQGGILGTLVSADALAEEDVKELEASFSKQLGKKIEFKVSVDPSLLAGLKVTVNGVTYDGTISAQLGRLRESFLH